MSKCNCALCNPQPGVRAHPKWGYDLNKVPAVHCFRCGKPIGDEPYREVTTLARFGQMSFSHKRCKERLKGGDTPMCEHDGKEAPCTGHGIAQEPIGDTPGTQAELES